MGPLERACVLALRGIDTAVGQKKGSRSLPRGGYPSSHEPASSAINRSGDGAHRPECSRDYRCALAPPRRRCPRGNVAAFMSSFSCNWVCGRSHALIAAHAGFSPHRAAMKACAHPSVEALATAVSDICLCAFFLLQRVLSFFIVTLPKAETVPPRSSRRTSVFSSMLRPPPSPANLHHPCLLDARLRSIPPLLRKIPQSFPRYGFKQALDLPVMAW